MKLQSTRDTTGRPYSYTDVLLQGLAPDGGLFAPQEYPHISLETLTRFKGMSYGEIAYEVKKLFVGESIPDSDLRTLVSRAYAIEQFPVPDGNIVPVTQIRKNFFAQNLSLGPTAAFKDMALQLLGHEMEYELARRAESLVILGATSGDTGSAAEASLKGREHITLFMLSPEVGMSAFQKAQMGSLTGGNIFNISIRGRFDDCQDLVKAVKHDAEFAHLGAVNSINWGRISAQVPYYVSGYVQIAREIGDPVDVVVPSGNFGNILAAYIAKRMGVPLRRLIVATNENNVLDTLFKTGVYERITAQVTSSPSMDISKASNYERLVFDVFGHDPQKTAQYMHEFDTTGRVSFESYGLSGTVLSTYGFASGSSTHADRINTIKSTYDTCGLIIDPHTADGVAVGERLFDVHEDVPMICMMTALPVKFEDTIREALGFVPERPERFRDLAQQQGGFDTLDADVEALKAYIRAHV